MKNKISILIICLILMKMQAMASIIYVDSAHVGGVQNGLSWTTAFSSFQNGINAAGAGDSVWVAKGTYQSDSANLYAFYMKEGVKILGGFLNTHNSISQRDWLNNNTILKGTTNSVINNINNYLTNASLIDGFTITDGYAVFGGGIKNYNASPTISNCNFYRDTVKFNDYTLGGAIYNLNSTSKIYNCSFIENVVVAPNTASYFGGGAIYNDSSNITIVGCTFSGNKTNTWTNFTQGGAIYNSASVLTISNSSFIDNSSGFHGGAIYNADGSVAVVDSCTFSNNIAGDGGAIGNVGSSITIHNCNFDSNGASSGGAIYNTDNMVLDDSYFIGNHANGAAGGAIYNANKAMKVNNCSFLSNSATNSFNDGGAIFAAAADSLSKITNCKFISNWTADGAGGGLCIFSSAFEITNCLFAKNKGSIYGYGGAMYSTDTSKVKIVNCTIVENEAGPSANGNGGSIYSSNGTTSEILNSIVWGNNSGIGNDSLSSSKIRYSLIQGMGLNSTYHNLDGNVNPMFVDTAAGLYQLAPSSSCINVGMNDSLPASITTDLAGNVRIFDATVELGAYEYSTELAPEINLGNDTGFCEGNSLTLNAQYAAYATYLWNTGATTRFLNVDTSGIYFVNVVNALGTSTDTIVVAVNPLPIISLGNDTILTPGNSLLLNAANPGSQYLWSTGDTTQTIHVTSSDTYSVVVTNSNGCSSSDTIVVQFGNVGVGNINEAKYQWSVSPNPTMETIYINVTDAALLHTTVSIVDFYGRIIQTVRIESKSQPISLSNLASGIYLLKMQNGETAKIVKQ